MAKTKVKLNLAGFTELRNSPEMVAGLNEMIQGVAQRAGDGYAADVQTGRKRAIARAYTESFEAMRESAKDGGDKLLEALQS